MAKGAAWMVAMRLSVRSIGLVSTIILVRLLLPSDFGLVAIATTIVALAEIFGDFSFDLALIQRSNPRREHFDAAWTLTVIRNGVIALLLLASARVAANFFNDPRIETLIYFLAGGTFLDGLQNIGVVNFRKELHFHQEFEYLLVQRLGGFIATVASAFWLHSYYALIIGILTAKGCAFIASYVMHPYRPRLSLREAPELLHFSKWILGNNVLLFFATRLDTFVIGHFLGSTAVGFYSISYEISNLPTTELIWPIQRALFPGYAKIAADGENLSRLYMKTLSTMLLFAAPCAIGIGVTAPLIVGAFLGAAWVDAINIMQALSLYGLVRVCFANSGPILLALGKTSLQMRFTVISVAVLVPMMLLGVTELGADGVALALAASAIITLAMYLHAVCRLLNLLFVDVWRSVWRIWLAAGVMAVIVHAVVRQSQALALGGSRFYSLLDLIGVSALGAAVYASVLLFLWCACGRPASAEAELLTTMKSWAKRLRLIGAPSSGSST